MDPPLFSTTLAIMFFFLLFVIVLSRAHYLVDITAIYLKTDDMETFL